jgi:7-cyano-7-deazaguanine synthase
MSRRSGGDVAVLVSGGLDSAVLAVDLLGAFARVFPIYVRFGLRWEAVELAHLGAFLKEAGRDRPGLMPLTVLDEPIAQVYGDHWSNEGRPGVPDAMTRDEAVYLPGRNVLLAAKAAVLSATVAFGVPAICMPKDRLRRTVMAGNSA